MDADALARFEELGAAKVRLLLSVSGLPQAWHADALKWLGDKMSGDSEIKGLAAIITDEVTKLRNKARTVNADLQAQLGDAHEALQIVEELGTSLRNAVSELRGALGQQTNNPPADEKK